MLRCTLLFGLVALAAASRVSAGQIEEAVRSGEIEIGTLFGVSHGDDEITTVQVPSAFWGEERSIAPLTALYLSWFPGEYLAIGPEINLGRTSADEGRSHNAITNLSLAFRAAFFSRPSSRSGVYFLGHSALFWRNWNGGDEANIASGLGLGYQWRIGPSFVLRVEGQYRRWFDPGKNVFALVFGLGSRLGGG